MFNEAKRPLAIYAHPDDEVIGATYAMRECSQRLSLAFVTDGAPLEEDSPEYYYPNTSHLYGPEYITFRRGEALRVAEIFGVTKAPNFVGLTDSLLHLQITELLNGLREVIEEVDPDLIITHAYEGGHLDHDLVVAAIWKILQETQRNIVVCETPLYTKKGDKIVHNERIARHQSWQSIHVAPDHKKAEAMAAYASQQIDLQYFDPRAYEHYHFQDQSQLAAMSQIANEGDTLYDPKHHQFILQLLRE